METKKIMFTAAVIFALLITIGSAFAVLPADNLEITDIKVGKTGETLVSYDDGNETAAFQPGDEITVKMKVKNNGDLIIHSIAVSINTDAALTGFPSTDNTPDPFYINPGQEQEVTYTYEIPAESITGSYMVDFTVDGIEYQTNTPYTDEQGFQLKIEQLYDNVFIDGVTYDQQLSCSDKGSIQEVEVKLVNIGEENPTYVTVELTSQALGIFETENFPVVAESENPGVQTVTLSYEPQDLVGQKQLTLKVYLTTIPTIVYDTEVLTVTGTDCVVGLASASPSQSSVVVDKQATQPFSVTLTNPENIDVTYQWSVDNNNLPQQNPEDAFTLDANNYALGQHTVKVTFSGQGVNVPPKTWNVEIADNSADFTISEIVFTDVESGATVTKQVTVKNVGSSEALTEIVASFVGVDSDYQGKITIIEPLKTSLSAGEQDTLTLEIDVPENADDGIVGKLRVEGNNRTVLKEANIDLNFKNYLKVSSVKVNGKTTGGLSLSESNEIKVEVRNDYTKDLDDVRVTVALLDEDGDDIESVEKDLFENGDSLGNGDEETVTLELDLQNEDLNENEYTLEITVEGSEGSNDYTTVETLTVQVDRGDEEVAITKAELSSSKLQCSAKTTLYVTIKNNSEKEFNNLKLRVRNNDLNLDLSKSNIDLEDYSGNDNEYETTFDLELTYAAADTYTLTVEVLDDNDVVASENVELEVKECLGESTASGNKEYYADEKLKDELQKSLEEYKRAQAQPVVKASFRESGEYTMLLGVLVILMAVASVLSMVVLLTRRR
mgnify:CR=1 FL=1